MKKIKLLLILLVVNSPSFATSDDVIKGFSKYQAGRVENILLNEMLYEIRDNRYFMQLFTQTNEAVDNYGNESGKRLIPLMQYFVKKDIDAFEEFSRCMVLSFYNEIKAENDLSKISSKSKSHYKKLQEAFNDSSYTVSKASTDYCSSAMSDKAVVLSQLNDQKVHEKLKELVGQLKEESLKNTKDDKLARKYKYWANVYEYTKYISSQDDSNYIKMHHLVLSFDKLGLNDGDVFYDFRKLSLFLAQLSDAAKGSSNGDAVEAIISNYVETENDSFNIKRTGLGLFSNYCSYKVCRPVAGIGAYFGAGYSSLKENRGHVYGPLSVEVRTFNYYGHMAYLGFAPLDFGIPIKNEFKDEQYSTSLDDIRSNSFYISYSYKHKPLSLIFSYHPDGLKSQGITGSYTMLSVAFDLPLYFF